jgi:two-component system NarL family response regulator
MIKIEPIKVMIIDDHPIVREGLKAMIDRRPDMTVVGEAENGREALERFLSLRPDVALVDLRMPEVDGLEAITNIIQEVPTARLIVLTTFDEDENIYRALRAGAKAYLLKDVPRQELIDCIRAVSEGRTLIPPAIAAKLAEHVSTSPLTGREMDVLRLVAAGHANKQIAVALQISEATVKTHINNLLVKLGAASRTEAVTIGLRRGLLRVD